MVIPNRTMHVQSSLASGRSVTDSYDSHLTYMRRMLFDIIPLLFPTLIWSESGPFQSRLLLVSSVTVPQSSSLFFHYNFHGKILSSLPYFYFCIPILLSYSNTMSHNLLSIIPYLLPRRLECYYPVVDPPIPWRLFMSSRWNRIIS